MRQQLINIEHPDLTKMDDAHLWNEAIYFEQHAHETIKSIEHDFMEIGRGARLYLPIRKIIDDLSLAVNRYQAICEEIRYRKENMI